MVYDLTARLLAYVLGGEQAVAALVEGSAAKLSQNELDRISRLIEEAKRKGA
ncbi:MAG: hypothetical protein WD733_18930 [Bryobacterales bacterium]